MKKILLASTREGTGKTSLIVGLAKQTGKKCAYIKPFGDRLIYRRKVNWDYDAELIKELWGMDTQTEDVTLGFNHAKLRYVYSRENIKSTLEEMVNKADTGAELLFIEGGRDLSYGASIFLDSISIAENLDCEPIIIISGENDNMMDDIVFLKNNLAVKPAKVKGIILNKVQDVDDFEAIYLKRIKELGIPILGMLPHKQQLTHFTMQYLAERLIAKVIAGEKGLGKTAKNIFVGAMSTHESLRNPLFNKENKLLITSGDRDDMILAALDSDTVGIILTNNILPPTTLLSKASERQIPLLLVTLDTYQVARQIDNMDALLTKYNDEKIELLAQMTGKYLDIDTILK